MIEDDDDDDDGSAAGAADEMLMKYNKKSEIWNVNAIYLINDERNVRWLLFCLDILCMRR